jgi:acyl-CoA carboxylase epsilon subunit
VSESSAGPEPVVRVVAGDPTAEELAALVAVLSAVRSAAAGAVAATEPRPRPVSAWSSPGRRMPPAIHPGVGGWRLSALPH